MVINLHDSEGTVHIFGSGDSEWQSTIDEEGGPTAARDALRQLLLSSLQMPNLVVLAGSGCSIAAGGPSMADLWLSAVGEPPSEAAAKVAATVNHDLADQNIEGLMSRVEAYLQVMEDADASAFLDDSKGTVLKECSQFLEGADLSHHLTLLHRMSRRRVRDQRLKIFTTNYDLCFERAVSELGGVALDGFSFTSPRRYDPRYFGYDIVRRPLLGDERGDYLEGVFLLYKLHGSVSWARKPDGAISEEVQPDASEACLIYPAAGKYQQAFAQPYLESVARYLEAIREPNTCVMTLGFGFNDDHLSEPLLGAVRSNPHLRMVVVDSAAKANCESPDRPYWLSLLEHARRGDDVWCVDASLQEFVPALPDLKSISPTASLINALEGVMKGP